MPTSICFFVFFNYLCVCSQNFTLRVKKVINNCSGSIVNDLNEPQMKWTLSKDRAEFYWVSQYDNRQKDIIYLYNVTSVEIKDDSVNGRAYIYKISNYKNGAGDLIYVPQERFIKITLNGQNCSIIYELF